MITRSKNPNNFDSSYLGKLGVSTITFGDKQLCIYLGCASSRFTFDDFRGFLDFSLSRFACPFFKFIFSFQVSLFKICFSTPLVYTAFLETSKSTWLFLSCTYTYIFQFYFLIELYCATATSEIEIKKVKQLLLRVARLMVTLDDF